MIFFMDDKDCSALKEILSDLPIVYEHTPGSNVTG
jgi:hypothetical protein